MWLSRKADYALLAVSHLASLKRGELASINSIAEAKTIPREFLAKILNDLTHSGILNSFHGAYGGYSLSRIPKNISFLEVVEAINGPLHLSLCTKEPGCGCNQYKSCLLRSFWKSQETILKKALKRENFAKYHVSARHSTKSRSNS